MNIQGNEETSTTFEVKDEANSSAAVLAALEVACDEFRDWQDLCDEIDEIYSRKTNTNRGILNIYPSGWEDAELDLFWASYEILKPAIYAHVPRPVVSTQFKDKNPVKNKTAELLERVSVSAFQRSDIDNVMCEIRDDLIFTNRGVMWLTYESKDGQKVCFEHLDRMDFRHEPARKWSEVGWVARRAWMTEEEMRERFQKTSGEAYKEASLKTLTKAKERGAADNTKKASVWEVWHKADNKVYWVSEGVDVFLDKDEPHLKLRGFFPCPRPAFGTLERRSMRPVPDYVRYSSHFAKINTLTSRIYLLLDRIKLKGLIPGGGDVANAIEQLIASDDDEILIPVPSAAMSGEMGNFVQWMPLEVIANTITGLIQARGQLIEDFYQLSGISDIMRGATEADETLGAQRMKSQYGSVRVRQKIQELERIARDAVSIAAEVIAENFSQETILEMSQTEVPTKADIQKQIKGIEKAAEAELQNLSKSVEEAASQDPEQVQQAAQQIQQQQQAIVSKYAGMLDEARREVPIDDVIDLLRDDRARGFAFEIEDGSTIWADEQAEKQSRNEFIGAFSQSAGALMPLLQTGPDGAKLAGGLFRFQLAPYRAGRELESLIDNWVDSVGSMEMPTGNEDAQAMVEANNKLAEAEMAKAQAQTAKVEADAQLKAVELQRKMQEMQFKAQQQQIKDQLEAEKLRGQLAEQEAKINKLQAETAEILSKIGLDVRKQDLEEYRTSNEVQQREVDTALRINSEGRAERGEARADRQQQFSEASTDRQMTMAERQAMERQGAPE